MCSYRPEAVCDKWPPEGPALALWSNRAACLGWEEPPRLWKQDRKLQQRILEETSQLQTPQNVAASSLFLLLIALPFPEGTRPSLRVASLAWHKENFFLVISTFAIDRTTGGKESPVRNIGAVETIRNILKTRRKKELRPAVLTGTTLRYLLSALYENELSHFDGF